MPTTLRREPAWSRPACARALRRPRPANRECAAAARCEARRVRRDGSAPSRNREARRLSGSGYPRRANCRFDVGEVLAAHGRRGAGEAKVGDLGVEAEDVEQLRSPITVEHGDAHLRHDFGEAGVESFQQARFALFARQRARGLQRQPRADGASAVADQHGGVMHVAAVAGFEHESDLGAQPGFDQRVMHRAGGHRHGNGQHVVAGGAVGHEKNANSAADQARRRAPATRAPPA